jgi:hypothetical protein
LLAIVALPSILYDDVGRRLLAATWGWVKLGHLIADSVLGINTTQLLGGVLNGADQSRETTYEWYVVRTASRHISP